MTVTLLVCFLIVDFIGLAVGFYLANNRFMKILEQINTYYVDHLTRILSAPVYVANPDEAAYDDEEACPDCGEIHDESDGDPEVN